jgi:hypothetical protein
MEEGLGARFWFGLIGVALAIGVGGILLFIFISTAWARWGLLGAFLFFSLVLLTFGYFYDRRQAKRYKDSIA